MAEESDRNTYGAVGSTQLINEDEQQEKVRNVDSFYGDDPTGFEDKRFLLGTDIEKRQLHNRRDEEQEEKSNENSENNLQITNDTTSTKTLQRPTRVSFSKEQQANQNDGAVTPVTPDVGRHVSFLNKASQNEPSNAGTAYDNRGNSDMQSSSDSLSRVRAITHCSVHYHTHSEAEECNESEISLVLSNRRSFSQTRASQTQPRRRRYTRKGTIVTDSFVNECICCCAIL